MFEMYIEATVRGYHAHLDNASVQIGENIGIRNGAQQFSRQICCGSQKPRGKPGLTCTKEIIEALS